MFFLFCFSVFRSFYMFLFVYFYFCFDFLIFSFLNKKFTLVVKNKYTKGNSIEYSRAFFEMLKSN